MAWLAENWAVVVGVAGSLLGTGGLLAWLRFRHIEVPTAQAERRSKEQDAYEKLLENTSEQGTLIAKLYSELADEREKRRQHEKTMDKQRKEFEDRLNELEKRLTIKDQTISLYEAGVAKLHKQVRDLGHEPVWAFEG